VKALLIALLLTSACHAGTYTVKRGDTLGHISLRLLGKASLWQRIYRANPKLKSPHRIRVGQVLTIPTKPQEAGDKVWVRIRYYCPNCRICGTNGRTAAGTNAYRCKGVASVLPRGSWVNIPGIGWKVVDDTGGFLRRLYRRTGIVQVEVCRDVSHWENYRAGHRNLFVEVRR
jgi:LysM repeat protein